MELNKEVKDSELESEVPDKMDEWRVSEQTSEETEMSEECHYVQFVSTKGYYITFAHNIV